MNRSAQRPRSDAEQVSTQLIVQPRSTRMRLLTKESLLGAAQTMGPTLIARRFAGASTPVVHARKTMDSIR